MGEMLRTIALFSVAAFFELGGAYLVWQWQRTGKPLWWAVLGLVGLFLYSLTQTVQSFGFGRAFAAYGGVFIIGAMLWGWFVDGHVPDRWDVVGGGICLLGVIVILAAPRT